MSEQLKTSEYSDVTKEHMARALKTAQFITAQVAGSTPDLSKVSSNEARGVAFSMIGGGRTEAARYSAAQQEATNPDINLKDMDRVNEMWREATTENTLRDAIANPADHSAGYIERAQNYVEQQNAPTPDQAHRAA